MNTQLVNLEMFAMVCIQLSFPRWNWRTTVAVTSAVQTQPSKGLTPQRHLRDRGVGTARQWRWMWHHAIHHQVWRYTQKTKSPYRLQSDLKCVEWDVKPYYIHTL